ncbi:MAG: Ldh family oxidoreductase [Chloroflexi bacterium]|nr:Ldh family oxidoreductase [Chloroflexota bacterium]
MATVESDARRYQATDLEHFTARVLEACGLPANDAALAARLMVSADLRGADGHGIFRLPQYVRRIRAGGMNPRPNARVLNDQPSTAIVDGDNGMGHLTMARAAALAIEKADRHGVAWVGVRNGNHAGPAALYAAMPIEHQMIGMYMAVASANHMPAWGGVEPILGTNPIAIGIPAGEEPPIVLDMATTVAAYGKVKTHAMNDVPMPIGWMIDREGQPITDARRASEGFLLPIGEHKGYGLAVIIGLLAGTLNQAPFTTDVIDFNADEKSWTNTGQMVLALNISNFLPVEVFKEQVDRNVRVIRESRRMKGVDRIWLPGEQSWHRIQERSTAGVPIGANLLASLDDVADRVGVERLSR